MSTYPNRPNAPLHDELHPLIYRAMIGLTIWLVLSIWPGAIVLGCVAYVAAWLLMPKSEDDAPPTRRYLVRSSTDRRIAGVCGGLADYFNIDPTIVRVAWMIVSIVPGAIVFGIIAYLVAWFIIPQAPAATLQTSPSMI